MKGKREEGQRSTYSVIPARVRDDPALPPNAKLLYGELSALARREGYCWASNAYLARLLGVSDRSVERLLRQLRERGHIRTYWGRGGKGAQVEERRIWICGPSGQCVVPAGEWDGDAPSQSGTPLLTKERETRLMEQGRPARPTAQAGRGQVAEEEGTYLL